jgi:CcmD family protein
MIDRIVDAMIADKVGYFFAAYGIVSVALVVYVGFLGQKLRALENRLASAKSAANPPG